MSATPPSNPTPNPVTPRYLPVVETVQRQMLAFYDERLREMQAQVEPVIMDFADRATSNRTQTALFESVRPLRVNWARVQGRFRQEIERGFREFVDGNPINFPYERKERQEGLELISDDAFDQFLAVRNMADKCYSEVREEIFALKQRLAMVRGGAKIESRDVPGGPLHTASAFQIALVDLHLGAEPLMVLYALFAKMVLGRTGEIYRSFNQRLIDVGIFPHLKFTVEKMEISEAALKAAARAAKKDAEGEGTGKGEGEGKSSDSVAGDDLLGSIRSMMLAQQRANPALVNHPELNPEVTMGKMADPATLVRSLAAVHPQQGMLDQIRPQGAPVARIEVDDSQIEQQRSLLEQEKEQLFQQIDPNSVRLVDLHTIELVGMLFQRVLDEQGLPNIVKALLGHLHTSYLKVAILDREFLSNPKHLARRLLDRMVEAGEKWVDETELRRGIYYPLQEVVDRILSEFKEDLGLFQEVSDQLERRIREVEQRATQIEERSRDAQMGREKLDSARGRAHHVLEQRVGERDLHSAMRHFIFQVWIDKLTFMLLRDPETEGKEEWNEAIAIVDALLRIHDVREDPRIRTRLPEILPNIRRRVEQGLETLGDYHQPHADALFELLAAYGEGDTQPPETAEMEVEDKAQEAASAAESPAELDPALLLELQELDFGQWFEFKEGDEGRPRRLKLSWFSTVSNRYMFVDGNGVAVMVLSVEALAKKMIDSTAILVEKERPPFVERALTAIRRTFQMAFGEPATA